MKSRKTDLPLVVVGMIVFDIRHSPQRSQHHVDDEGDDAAAEESDSTPDHALPYARTVLTQHPPGGRGGI